MGTRRKNDNKIIKKKNAWEDKTRRNPEPLIFIFTQKFTPRDSIAFNHFMIEKVLYFYFSTANFSFHFSLFFYFYITFLDEMAPNKYHPTRALRFFNKFKIYPQNIYYEYTYSYYRSESFLILSLNLWTYHFFAFIFTATYVIFYLFILCIM